ncbi:hypothetical protein [Streptomyces sp. NPDC002078]
MASPEQRANEIPAHEERRFGPKELLAGAAGVFTAAAALIYIAGGAVLAARMQAARFWWGLVLGQMPRQVLEETAVSTVLIPAVIFVALSYLIPLALLPREWRLRHRTEALFERFPRSAFSVLAILLTVPGVISWIHHKDFTPQWWLMVLAVIVVLPFTMTIGIAVQHMRPYKLAHPKTWIAAVATAMMLAAIPGLVVLAASLPLPFARACGKGYELDTRFIGAASDWVYLGQYAQNKQFPPRLAMVPTSQIDAVTVSNGVPPGCGPNTGELGTSKPTS